MQVGNTTSRSRRDEEDYHITARNCGLARLARVRYAGLNDDTESVDAAHQFPGCVLCPQ